MNQDTISTMREMFAKELDLSKFSLEEQEEMILMLTDTVVREITLEVMKRIPEEQVAEYAKESLAEDPKAMFKFMESKVPNIDEIAGEVMKREIASFKEFMQEEQAA